MRLWRQDLQAEIEARLDAYAVVTGSGDIITVGHRTRRINRN